MIDPGREQEFRLLCKACCSNVGDVELWIQRVLQLVSQTAERSPHLTDHILSSGTDLYIHSPTSLHVVALNYAELTNARYLHLNYITHTILTSVCPNIASSMGGKFETRRCEFAGGLKKNLIFSKNV